VIKGFMCCGGYILIEKSAFLCWWAFGEQILNRDFGLTNQI